MRLIDEVVRRDEHHVVCRKTFRADEFFFQGHYPHFPLVPGVILCEAALQAGAVLLSRFVDGSGVPVATRLNEVKFKQMVRPGDTIEIETTLKERLADAFFLTAKISLGGKIAARLDFACTLAPLGERPGTPTVAILGASVDRTKFGNKSLRAHRERGYAVYPVNPKGGTIEGEPVFRTLAEIPVALDRISVYLPPNVALGLLDEIVAKGCRELWLNPGSESPGLVAAARARGLNVIADCSIVQLGVSPSDL